MTTDELANFYVALLIMQYRALARAQATIDALAKAAIADQVTQQVYDGFAIDTAIGIQLDILGQYRGISRVIFGLDLGKVFLSLPLYSNPDPAALFGFALYADGTPAWYLALYADDENPIYALSDPDMRSFLAYLAKLQSMGGGLAEIDLFLYEFFGTYVTLTDNGDMTITYAHDPTDPENLFTIVENTGSLPSPAGVLVGVV